MREVTRHIPVTTQVMLWGRAAGRCEFAGCNKPLWKSPVTQEPVNIGQKAHIYAVSSDGPRGRRTFPKKQLHADANLMLVCHGCHRKIDNATDGGRYTAALLQSMKAAHERRVEIVTSIAPSKNSHVLLYGANVGDHSSPLNFADAAHALFPRRYPADDKAIELGMVNSSFVDRDDAFWALESADLAAKINRRVRERLAAGEIKHLSIFALAPQPLLILLGSLLTDIPRADVFQLHREPAGWLWPRRARPLTFRVKEPSDTKGLPALVLSLSATVTDDRITSVLGARPSIWTVTVDTPHNDITKSPAHLRAFRSCIRPLLDRIKACHGQTRPLHIFLAASVSFAVELGRVRMPKADTPWIIYDQVNHRGGFVRALTLPLGDA